MLLAIGFLPTHHYYKLFPLLQVRVFFIVSQYMIPLSSIGQKRETSVNLLWKLAVCFCFVLIHIVLFPVLSWTGVAAERLLLYFSFRLFLVFSSLPNCTYLGYFYSVSFLCCWIGGELVLGGNHGMGMGMGIGIERTRPRCRFLFFSVLGNTLGREEGGADWDRYITFRLFS
jgi:hypothetical protein